MPFEHQTDIQITTFSYMNIRMAGLWYADDSGFQAKVFESSRYFTRLHSQFPENYYGLTEEIFLH